MKLFRFFLPAFALLALVQSTLASVIVVGSLARHSTIRPGEVFEGVILLKNTDPKDADVRVYQTDYLCQADGSNDYAEPGTQPRSNGKWISLSASRVRLAPGETIPLRYKGRAPADAKLRGTFWSMVMVEPSAPPAVTPHGEAKQVAMGLQTQIRFGVQIVTHLGKDGARSLRVQDKSIQKLDGKRLLQLDIANDGERLIIPSVGVELFDAKGSSIGRFEGGRSRIFPTCSIRAKVDLSDVPAGKYTAMVLMDGGDDQVMAAQYDLTLEP